MKSKLSVLTGVCFMLLIVACKKDDSTPTNSTGGNPLPATTTPTFNGQVNGVAKNSNTISGTFNGTSFAINGSGTNFSWGMYVHKDAVVGQAYDLASTNLLLISYSDVTNGVDYLSDAGTATVTKKDTVNKILEVSFSGTFADFNGVAPSIPVANGVMKTYYTE